MTKVTANVEELKQQMDKLIADAEVQKLTAGMAGAMQLWAWMKSLFMKKEVPGVTEHAKEAYVSAVMRSLQDSRGKLLPFDDHRLIDIMRDTVVPYICARENTPGGSEKEMAVMRAVDVALALADGDTADRDMEIKAARDEYEKRIGTPHGFTIPLRAGDTDAMARGTTLGLWHTTDRGAFQVSALVARHIIKCDPAAKVVWVCSSADSDITRDVGAWLVLDGKVMASDIVKSEDNLKHIVNLVFGQMADVVIIDDWTSLFAGSDLTNAILTMIRNEKRLSVIAGINSSTQSIASVAELSRAFVNTLSSADPEYTLRDPEGNAVFSANATRQEPGKAPS